MFMNIDPINIAQSLIRCDSITPHENGALGVVEKLLAEAGFVCQRLPFSDPGETPVDNLYARFGTEGSNFCFAGHVDVVPPGDFAAWTHPPFGAEIHDGFLYGRGAEDMKGAIAAFLSAALEFVKKPFKGSISFLLTCDEEGPALHGTRKVLAWMQERGEKLDACIVGEPTNPSKLGEMAKIGRRGSAYGILTVQGKQGHVAYPHLADNPVRRILNMCHALQHTQLDGGSSHFPPSNLEVTSLDVGNPTGNVIPSKAEGRFNIRFNNNHDRESIEKWVRARLDEVGGKYDLKWRVSGEAFLTPPGKLSEIVVKAVQEVTGLTPELSTTGGTSDARFIHKFCPVVEFGTTGLTAHMVDERVKVEDVGKLKEVYGKILQTFFA